MSRGQTTLDFAIGVSIFILVIVFTFTFVPTTLQPFEESAQQETVVADRIATQLSSELLATPESPYVLDRECTIAFFAPDNNENNGGSSEYPILPRCSFLNVDSVNERLGLKFTNIRIRIVRDLTTAAADDPDGSPPADDDQREVLCFDPDDTSTPRIVESDNPSSCDPSSDPDVAFEVGDDPPDTVSVVSASRVVEFSGGFADGTSDATLIVEVW